MKYIRKIISEVLMKLSLFKSYSTSPSLRSDSDNGKYVKAVNLAVKYDKYFSNFKRNPIYNEILEHVSYEQGKKYLDILMSRDDQLIANALKNVLISDFIGNPIKYHYTDIDIKISPTTLRYVKVASDLNILFGKGLNKIAEIGCGYGGQCIVNNTLLNYQNAFLFDLPQVNRLVEKYVEHFLLNGSYKTSTINQVDSKKYDLAISNYAFSELPLQVQAMYIDKILKNSHRGYITMNSGLSDMYKTSDKFSLKDLKLMLPDFIVIQENPLTRKDNYIIVWGHRDGSLNNNFKLFDLDLI
jgi:putative sugar O-methyltransferase